MRNKEGKTLRSKTNTNNLAQAFLFSRSGNLLNMCELAKNMSKCKCCVSQIWIKEMRKGLTKRAQATEPNAFTAKLEFWNNTAIRARALGKKRHGSRFQKASFCQIKHLQMVYGLKCVRCCQSQKVLENKVPLSLSVNERFVYQWQLYALEFRR